MPLLLILAVLTLCGASASAATFNAFGPKQYVRGEGDPVTVTDTFTVLNPSTTYTLRIVNGSLTDTEVEHVSTSIITLNGVQIVDANEFNQNTTVFEKVVTLQASNTLTVLLRGRPSGEITLTIRGVDNDLPTITAHVADFLRGRAERDFAYETLAARLAPLARGDLSGLTPIGAGRP